MSVYTKREKGEAEVYYTKRGVLYAKPKQILHSKNAKKQIKAFKDSRIFRKIRKSK